MTNFYKKLLEVLYLTEKHLFIKPFLPKRYVYPWDGTQNQLCMKLPSVLTLVRSWFVYQECAVLKLLSIRIICRAHLMLQNT